MLVTALPWLLALATGLLGAKSVLLDVPLILLGAPHVLATFALFAEPGLRPHILRHRTFYVGAPILCVGGCLAVFAFSPEDLLIAAFTGLLLWQIWHFTKQNLGMFAFWTKARDLPSPTGAERTLIKWTSLIGMAGVIRLARFGPLIEDVAQAVGLLAILVLTVAVLVLAGRHGLPRTLALLASIAFFAPVVIFDFSLITAALAYEAAHGAQYYLMVGTATRSTRTAGLTAVLALVVVGAPFAWVGTTIDPLGADAWMFGAYKGVIAWHFVADSRLWRLRDADIRTFMKQRFAFL